MVIKQTSIVEVSVVENFTAVISSSTIKPLVQSNSPSILLTSDTAAKEEKSPEPLDPTDAPSMFSTSMAPPRPTQAGQREELITTVAPTIREDHDDLPDFDNFFDNLESENPTSVGFIPPHGDAFHDPDSAALTEPGPTEEHDDLSVIEINTIRPDIPMLDPSVITEPMFAEGKTEETILVPGIAVATTPDLTDDPTETTEVTAEEVFSSSETMPTSVYDVGVDEIETHFGVEALPRTQPPEEDLISPTDGIETDTTTAVPTETPYMCNTQPGNAEVTTTEPPEQRSPISTTTQSTRHAQSAQTTAAAAILPDSGELTEDESSPGSVRVFDESTSPLTEHVGDALARTDVTTEIDPEFLPSFPTASAASRTTRPPTTAVTHPNRSEQSSRLTTPAHLQHAGKAVQTPLCYDYYNYCRCCFII